MTNESDKNGFDPEMNMALHGQVDVKNNQSPKGGYQADKSDAESAQVQEVNLDQTPAQPTAHPELTVVEGEGTDSHKQYMVAWKSLRDAQDRFKANFGPAVLGATMAVLTGAVAVSLGNPEMQDWFDKHHDLSSVSVLGKLILGYTMIMGAGIAAWRSKAFHHMLKGVGEMRRGEDRLAHAKEQLNQDHQKGILV